MSQQQQQKKPRTRVLVADDDHSIRQLVCTIIKREGLEVDCVADGVEAIEKLKENEYAVLLLDLMMPRVDGFGVVEYLKQNPPSQKPVVLVITAYADQKFKEVDPNIVSGVLRKPFEVADLGNVVRHCVHGFDAATELSAASDRAIRDLASRHWSTTSSQGGNGSNGNGDGAH